MLLTSISNSLTSLDIDLGIARASMYFFDICNWNWILKIHTLRRLLWLYTSSYHSPHKRRHSSYTFCPPTSWAADYPCHPSLHGHWEELGIVLPHPCDHTTVLYQYAISQTFIPQLRLHYRKPPFGSKQVSSVVFTFRSHLYSSRPPFINYICIRVPRFLLCFVHPSCPPPWWSI